MKKWHFSLIIALHLTSPILADEIIGVEDASGKSSDEQSERAPSNSESVEGPDADRAFAHKQVSRNNSASVGMRRSSHYADEFYFVGGIWPNSGYFSGTATLGYSINPYFGLELSGHYTRFDRREQSGQAYGPEIDLVLRGSNNTIVTPFLGCGPGFEKWRRAEQDIIFSEGQTLTASGYLGVNVALTEHFGLSAVRKRRRLIYDRPLTFSDPHEKEAREIYSNQIGFHLYL